MPLWMRATCKLLNATPIVAQSTYNKFCTMLHRANISTRHVWPSNVAELATCRSFDPFWPLFTPYFHFNNQQLTTFGDVLIDDYLSSVILDYCAHMNLVLTVNAVNQLNAIFHNHFTLRRFARQLQFQEFAIPTNLTSLTASTEKHNCISNTNKDKEHKERVDINCNNSNDRIEHEKINNEEEEEYREKENKTSNEIHACHVTLDFLEAHKAGLRKRDIAGTSFQITPLSAGQSPLGWKFSHFIGALHNSFDSNAVNCMLEHTYGLSGIGNLPHVASQLLVELVKEFSAPNITEALLAAQGIPARFIGKTRILPNVITEPKKVASANNNNSNNNSGSSNSNKKNNIDSDKNEEKGQENEMHYNTNTSSVQATNVSISEESYSDHANSDVINTVKVESSTICEAACLDLTEKETLSVVSEQEEQQEESNEETQQEFIIVSGFDQREQNQLEQEWHSSQGHSNKEFILNDNNTLDHLTKLIEAASTNGQPLTSTELAKIMQTYSSLPTELLHQLVQNEGYEHSLAEGPGVVDYIDTWTKRTNALVERHLEPPVESAVEDGWLSHEERRSYAHGPAFAHCVDFTLSSSFSDEYGIPHPVDGKMIGYSKFKKQVRDPLFYDKMSDMRNGVPFDTQGEPLHTYLDQFYKPHQRLFEVSLLVGPEEGNKLVGRAIATRYTVAREAVCRGFIVAILRDLYQVNGRKYNKSSAHVAAGVFHNNNTNNNNNNIGSDDNNASTIQEEEEFNDQMNNETLE